MTEQIRLRLPGEITTFETRHDSHEDMLHKKQRRYKQVVECLREKGDLTAKECAVALYQKGYVQTIDRNEAAPRLSELEEIGVVEAKGKKPCSFTGKMVTIYTLRDKEH